MHDWRYATPDASLGPAPGVGQGPRHLGLLRWLVGCAALAVASCGQQGVLDPQGPIASAQLLLLLNSTAIMLVVVIPVILATLGFAWWYRSSNARASRSMDEGYEGRTEFVLWSIPTLIVILLGGVIWISSHQLDPRAPIATNANPLRVEVVELGLHRTIGFRRHRFARFCQFGVGGKIERRSRAADLGDPAVEITGRHRLGDEPHVRKAVA